MQDMIDWDKLHTFLVVMRVGTLSAAARELGVDQTTIGRRIESLESELGARLFERSRSGLRATALAAELRPYAERMEQDALGLERRAAAEDAGLTGSVRLTATEAFAARLLFPHFEAWQQRYPTLELDLVITNQIMSLDRREADVAVRMVRPQESSLVARRAAELAIGLYASRGYLRRFGLPQEPGWAGHRVLGYNASAAGWPEAQWLSAHAGKAHVVVRQSSILGSLAGAVAGVGVAVLPCFLGDSEPELERVLPPQPSLTRSVWLVTHRDMQRNARVRALLSFLAELLHTESPRLRGQVS